MNHLRPLAILLPLTALLLSAQAPQLVDDPQFGFSFTLPSGYQAQRQPFGYLIARQGTPGVVLVLPLAESAMPKLRAATEEGLLAGDEVQLRPTAAVRSLTPRSLAVEMAGTVEGTPVRAYAITLGGTQRSAYVVCAAPVAQFSEMHTQLVQSIVQSVKFATTTATSAGKAPAASNDPATAHWDQRLRGRKLHYFNTYNSSSGGTYSGYSQRKTIGLCEDGTFSFNGQFSGSIDVPGASASMNNPTNNAGRWNLVSRGGAVYLQLGNETITLTTDGSKTFLNGTRWLVDDREKGCR
jgi:hypothetical protein